MTTSNHNEKGVCLRFQPFHNNEGFVEGFDIYLCNHLRYSLMFSFSLLFEGDLEDKSRKEAGIFTETKLTELLLDDLNDRPELQFEFWVKERAPGFQKQFSISFKPKAKSIFKRLRNEEDVLFYELFPNLPKAVEKPVKAAQPEEPDYGEDRQLVDFNSPSVRVNFPGEIDLHIEKLTKNHQKLSNAEKLKIQLRAFEDYLAKALMFHVPHVFIIHGIGKGKLKTEIHNILSEYPDVSSFKNEYHHKYGFGATEVRF